MEIPYIYTISPPLTTQCARASAILTQISGNEHFNPAVLNGFLQAYIALRLKLNINDFIDIGSEIFMQIMIHSTNPFVYS